MEKNELGFPLEYSDLSEYYDPISGKEIHAIETKNRLIESILKKYHVSTVLDLTCGTGSQVLWLAKHGYIVTGSDLSPHLLKIAKRKALKEKVDVNLIKGDMRTIKAGTFDAVITIFNAIGHLTKSDFEKAIENIYNNLKTGGLYVFDIFNLQAMTDKAVSELAMDIEKTVNDAKIHNIQYSKIDRKSGHLTSYDQFIIQKGSEKPKTLKGEFTLQLYKAKELREMLKRNGFKTLDQCGIDGSKFSEDETLNILTVAIKE